MCVCECESVGLQECWSLGEWECESVSVSLCECVGEFECVTV